MATAQGSDNESSNSCDSEGSEGCDLTDGTDSSGDSDIEVDSQPKTKAEPCKFYNSGGCRDGDKCLYLHVCKYAFKGHCRNGPNCKLSHAIGLKARSQPTSRSTSGDPKLTNGKHFQWQLNDGNGWKDIENDHIIEAQFCLPHTKSIKIYSTPYGGVSIDFARMRVNGKKLTVRRLDDGKTTWNWYCTLSHKWRQYGDKDSKGKSIPVKSDDIEKKFQSNPTGSYTFNVGAETLEIRFSEMRQVSKNRKRKVIRRPEYRPHGGTGVSPPTTTFQNLSVGKQWEYDGNSGWHGFKNRSGSCSVTSNDIEKNYQQNPSGSMTFTVKGQSYKLDFKAMTQTNLTTNKTRKIRRV